MHMLMNLDFANEIAAQRRQELTKAADRYRLGRLSSRKAARRATGHTGHNPGVTSTTDADVVTVEFSPAPVVQRDDHCPARVA